MNNRRKTANLEYFLIALTGIALAVMFYLSRGNGYVLQEGARISSELELQAETIVIPVKESVNVNTASADELQTLPGVGESLARRIIEDRNTNGPFWEKEDLVRVSGIGEATLAALEPYITTAAKTTEAEDK